MNHRVPLLAVVIVATALGACRDAPSGPNPSTGLLRDAEDPECPDTVYMDSTATRASAGDSSTTTSSTCHPVIIWY